MAEHIFANSKIIIIKDLNDLITILSSSINKYTIDIGDNDTDGLVGIQVYADDIESTNNTIILFNSYGKIIIGDINNLNGGYKMLLDTNDGTLLLEKLSILFAYDSNAPTADGNLIFNGRSLYEYFNGFLILVDKKELYVLTDNNESANPSATSYIDLQSGKSGRCSIVFGDGLGYADFIFTTAGVVTIIASTTNVFTSLQTGTDHVIIKDNGTNVRIVNELSNSGNPTTFNTEIKYTN